MVSEPSVVFQLWSFAKPRRATAAESPSLGVQIHHHRLVFNALTVSSFSSNLLTDVSGKLFIPLYNVLWAEISEGAIVVDYAAQPSKISIKQEKWTFPLPKSSDPHDGLTPEDFVAELISRAYGDSQLRKRAYVLINPHAGPGGALRKWSNVVKPLLEAARMQLDVVTLSRGGEATELAEAVDIDQYDTIMACSGDGTPHEIFNGLAKRPDASRALSKIAVSHIPCGSGNAMACNLYGSHRPALAALAIIKGVVAPLDLVSITQGDRRLVSFLSQALGIIAESDLGTENLRWMGSSRFELGMVMRLFRRRTYPCDLAVKVEIEDKDDVKAHYKRHASDASYKNSTESVKIENGTNQGLPKLKYGTVQDELPDGWELVPYDKIGNFYCGNVCYPCLFLYMMDLLMLWTDPSLRWPTWPPMRTFSRQPWQVTAAWIW